MTNPPTDERRAAFEAWMKTRPGFPFAGTYANLMWASWQAALSHQGEVVKVSDVQKVIDRWDNGQYGPGQVVEALRNLTALIAKANGHE